MIRLEELASKVSDDFPTQKLESSSVFSRAGEDLTVRAAQEPDQRVFGRDEEMDFLITILTRRYRPNPILIGESGVGKTVLVEHLAWRIVKKRVPPALRRFKVCRTSFQEMWSSIGHKDSNEAWPAYQAFLKKLVSECVEYPILCFMDEIHTVWMYPVSTNALKGPIAEGRLRVIGATTGPDYQRYFAPDKALERRFQPVVLEPPRGEKLAAVVAGVAAVAGRDYDVTVGPEARDTVIRMSDAYLFNRSQPDRALDLLEMSCLTARRDADESEAPGGTVEVTVDHVKAAVSRLTGIETSYLNEARTRLEGLARRLKVRVRGQDEAVERVAERLLVTKMRLDMNPNRPDGVFLFAGPTGVGKTELARAIADAMTGSEDHLLKLDMGNYKEPYSVNLLLGPDLGPNPEVPPEPSVLTRFAREHPFGVLLLDEIEKAHPEVLHLFLSVLDDGSFRDRRGNVVWFSFTTVIMTTNLGFGHEGGDLVGFTPEADAERAREQAREAKVRETIECTLPRELLGRLDDIIVFRPLAHEVLCDLVRRRLERMGRLVGVSVSLDEEQVSDLARRVYDTGLGARALDRTIEKRVGVPLARRKLRGEL